MATITTIFSNRFPPQVSHLLLLREWFLLVIILLRNSQLLLMPLQSSCLGRRKTACLNIFHRNGITISQVNVQQFIHILGIQLRNLRLPGRFSRQQVGHDIRSRIRYFQNLPVCILLYDRIKVQVGHHGSGMIPTRLLDPTIEPTSTIRFQTCSKFTCQTTQIRSLNRLLRISLWLHFLKFVVAMTG